MGMEDLNDVIKLLSTHHQRATYEAVGATCGGLPARSLMTNLTRSKPNSFVVSKATHMPTGYSEFSLHENLKQNPHVIETEKELMTWIRKISTSDGPAS